MFFRSATLLALFNVVVMLGMVSAENDKNHKRSPSLIVLIPDGFGASQATLAREFIKVRDNIEERHGAKLNFDDYHVGSISTKSANNYVTDSAAAGTSFACGVNTNNGIIGYDDEINVVANVLEGAKHVGYRTGLVTTTRITHATPAAFSSHVYDRDAEDKVAVQQLGGYVLGPQVDLLWGGGRDFFLPESANGSRTDERNLVEEAKEKGWNVALTRGEFDAYTKDSGAVRRSRIAGRDNWSHLPSLGLFAGSHLDYELDRDAAEQPSLAEMTVGALNALDSDDKPFFLMVEAGRIDHAGHGNDAAGILHDVLAYNDVWAETVKWIDSHHNKHDYLVLATADHDTGALNLANNDGVNWDPSSLMNVTNTCEYLAEWIEEQGAGLEGTELTSLVETVLAENLGVNVTAVEEENMTMLLEAITSGVGGYAVSNNLTIIRNTQSGLNWGTGGHSSVDVSLYAYPQDNLELIGGIAGQHPNVWIGQWIAKYLGLDLSAVQAKLDTDGSLRNETLRLEILEAPSLGD